MCAKCLCFVMAKRGPKVHNISIEIRITFHVHFIVEIKMINEFRKVKTLLIAYAHKSLGIVCVLHHSGIIFAHLSD